MANPLPSSGLTPSMASRMHKRAKTEKALYDLNASQALQRQKNNARSDEVDEEVNEDLSQEPYINDARSSSYSLSSDNYKTYSATELSSAAQIYDSGTFDFVTGLAGSAHVKLSDDRRQTSSSKTRMPKPFRAMKSRSKSATAMHQAADIEILGTHVPSDIPEGNRPDSPTLPPMLLYPQKLLGPHPSFFATSNPMAPIDGTYHKPPQTLPSASPVSTPAVVYTDNSLFPRPHPARHLIHNNLPGANPLLTPELPKLSRRDPPPFGRHPALIEIRGVHPLATSEPPKPLGRHPSYSDLRVSDPPRPSQSPSHLPIAPYRPISPEPVDTISAATPGQTFHSQENPSPGLIHRNKHNNEADRTRLHTLLHRRQARKKAVKEEEEKEQEKEQKKVMQRSPLRNVQLASEIAAAPRRPQLSLFPPQALPTSANPAENRLNSRDSPDSGIPSNLPPVTGKRSEAQEGVPESETPREEPVSTGKSSLTKRLLRLKKPSRFFRSSK